MTESRKLGVLIISSDQIEKWILYPDSNLDRRYVAPFEYF